MNSGRRLIPSVVLLAVVSLLMAGCIIIDDDSDDKELIIVDNYTAYDSIAFYLDGRFMGWIGAYEVVDFRGHFAGYREFYAEDEDTGVRWGPDYFSVPDDGTFTWELL